MIPAQGQPVNDLICNATVISTSLPINQIITGATTISATNDGLPFCGTSNTSPGVWYKLEIDNGIINPFCDCNDILYEMIETTPTFDTKLSVFTANSCTDTLICVDGDDDSGDGLASSVTYWMF